METDETPFPDLRFSRFKWLVAGVCTVLTALALVVFGQSETPENPTAVLQQSLKDQQFYSGAITGEYDQATREAVRRFQIRYGLNPNSKLDAATLEAILSSGRQMSAQPADAAPVAQSGAARELAESTPARERSRQFAEDDRQFLAELEGRPLPTKEEPPEPEPPASATTSNTPPKLRKKDAIQFLNDYLRAAQGPTPEKEISFFGDEVKYFSDRKVSKATIALDQQAYYRRWPERKFSLLAEPQATRTENGDFLVIFRIRYDLRRGDEKAKGRTENIIRIRNQGDGPKIVAIRERKIEG